MRFANKENGKFSIGITILLSCFIFTPSYGNGKEVPDSTIQFIRLLTEKVTILKESVDEILNITKFKLTTDTLQLFEQKVSPKPRIIEQKIIYERNREEEISLNRKVDSSIYFATLVVVIMAFILQGIRMWLSGLRQDYFTVVKFLSSDKIAWDEKKHNDVKKKLQIWFKSIGTRVKLLNWIFGILYLLLLAILILFIFLHLLHSFYLCLATILYITTALSGIALLIGMGLLIWPVIEKYGGVEESLRNLQKDVVDAIK